MSGENVPQSGPNAPGHLSERAKRFWREIIRDYPDLGKHQLEILRRVCEVIGIADEARQTLTDEGVTTTKYTPKGESYPAKHPAWDILKDAVIQERLLLKELYLDTEEDDPV